MRYVYFKAAKGNIGDDLNGWLWPKLFGNEDQSDKRYFYGIGTILHTDVELLSPTNGEKIFFGTGFRPRYNKCVIQADWDVKFLRGPLSAYQLQNKNQFITDGAYALRQLDDYKRFKSTKKKYKVSLMPHFSSVDYINWEFICQQLGFNYISPRPKASIENLLSEIAASEVIIAEAMHGAILADIFRIPWQRFVLSTKFFEGPMVSEYKWLDWILSVDIPDIHTNFFEFHRNTKLGRSLLKLSKNKIDIKIFRKPRIYQELLKTFKSYNDNFNLSTDSAINRVDEKLHEQVVKFQAELEVGT